MVADAGGRIAVFKVPSVPDDPGAGAIAALEKACAALDLSLADFLGDCQFFLHGSTVATNTLLEGKGGRVGLLATAGFRDSLEARRGLRKDPWDHRTPYPPVLVPRYLRLAVRGRIGADGGEIEPVALDDVSAAIETFREEGVDSVAICLINSFKNPAHEHAAAEVVRRSGLCRWVSVSADIVPIMGEYERVSTVAVNAYVMPRVADYLAALADRLAALGLKTRLLMLQSNGGAASLDQLVEQPVNLLLSGPSAGVGAIQHLAKGLGEGNLVSMEIGGTSCDVMLMHEGRVAITDSLSVAEYDLVTPSVDIHTVGAGGGTIAGLDGAGMMYAGPEGAGAHPGPAAYGLGGTLPTVTDAHLVLGRLRPGAYAGGSVTLELEAAERAIADAVAPAARDPARRGGGRHHPHRRAEPAARGRAHLDPARLQPGPLHPGCLRRGRADARGERRADAGRARGLRAAPVRRVLRHRHAARRRAPRLRPGGDARARRRHRRGARRGLRGAGGAGGRRARPRGVRAGRGALRPRARPALRGPAMGRARGARPGRRARRDPAPPSRPSTTGNTATPTRGGRIVVSNLRVVGIGKLPPLAEIVFETAERRAEPASMRPVFDERAGGFLETAIFDGAAMRPGDFVDGPAVIEEETTTVVVGSGERCAVDRLDNYLITFREAL